MSFGKKLQLLRVTNNLSQKEMSERLNVSQPVYSRFENDEKSVGENDDFAKRVAEEFDVTRKWLVAEEGNSSIFESGGFAKSANGIGQIENYYSLPKDFMEVYFRQQQQMLEMILNKFDGRIKP